LADPKKKATSKKKTSSKKAASGKSLKKTTSKKSVKKAAAKKKTVNRAKTVKKAVKKTSPKKVTKEITSTKQPVKTTPKAKGKKKKKDIPEQVNNKELTTVDEEIDDHDALNRGDEPMSVVGHLDEFRSRIIYILGALIGLTFIGFYFSEYIVQFINMPFVETGQKLNVFKLLGGFMIRLKASAVIALLLTVPLIFYHLWKFIVPAINRGDRMFSRISLLGAIMLFYIGMAFVFFVVVPFVIPILVQFIPGDMLSTIGADDYLSFILLFSISMGILFELPIVIMILTRIGILTPAFLISKRKYAVVMSFIIGAFITPQDPISMIMVAVPLMFLYEISIVISRFMIKRRKKKELMLDN